MVVALGVGVRSAGGAFGFSTDVLVALRLAPGVQVAQIDANTLPGPCPGGIGLTTALVALKTGWVVVGSLPTTDGTSATAQAGCLLVLDSKGNVVETFYGSLINGPWDMTASDGGDNAALFVTNVLNGTVAAAGNVVNRGTVVRITLSLHRDDVPRKRASKLRPDPHRAGIGNEPIEEPGAP